MIPANRAGPHTGRLVDLVGALAHPLAAGAGAVCPVAFSLSATFATGIPARYTLARVCGNVRGCCGGEGN